MERWIPVNDIPGGLYLDELIDNYQGVSLSLRGEDSDRVLRIEFGLHVISYQSTAEHCVLKTLDNNASLNVPWSLFTSTESDYINLLVEESYKIIDSETKIHYLIKHADGIINVISSQAPQVKWT